MCIIGKVLECFKDLNTTNTKLCEHLAIDMVVIVIAKMMQMKELVHVCKF